MNKIILNANRIILSKKDTTDNFTNKRGVEIPSDYTFTKILAINEKNTSFKVGDIACVLTNKLKDEIPLDGELCYLCFDYDVAYTLPNTEGDVLKDTLV